jgi:hypothetical protein
MITVSSRVMSERDGTSQLVFAQQKPVVHQSHFQTFRDPLKTQMVSEYDRLKGWLQQSSLVGSRCWLDELGCLRRNNSTYIFNEKGEVVTMSADSFNRFVDERLLLLAFGQ